VCGSRQKVRAALFRGRSGSAAPLRPVVGRPYQPPSVKIQLVTVLVFQLFQAATSAQSAFRLSFGFSA
jgi:hypothetical protein